MSNQDLEELTHSQLQIAVGQRLHPSTPLYNMAFAFVIEGRLDPLRFEAAWSRVVAGSEVLRTRIVERPGGAFHRIEASSTEMPGGSRFDFSAHPDPEGEFVRWCGSRCCEPLSLEGPLFESVLVHLGPSRTGWYLNQHHLVTDAWSTRLLFQRVAAAYEALSKDASENRETDGYYRIAGAQEAATRKAVSPEAESHWRQRSERSGRRVDLYGTTTSSSTQTASRRLSLQLGAERTQRLQRLGSEEGFISLSIDLSRFTVLATLLAAWLSRVGANVEVGFDTPVVGRRTAAAKAALGLFIEMFPFAASVPPGTSFRGLGEACLREGMALLRYGLPGLSTPSSESGSVVLNYVPFVFGDFAGRRARVEWLHPGHGDSVHALRLQVHDFSGVGDYRLDFDVQTAAIPHRIWERIPHHFETLLDAMLDDPDRPIDGIDLRTDSERQHLALLNATWEQPTPTRTVVESFEAVAVAEPDRVALRLILEGTERQTVTFRELRSQMLGLARYLVEQRGLRPGERVAILGDRTIETVVGVLAVLRARGAYVPIDPSHPEPRRRQILEDSGAVLQLDDSGIRDGIERGRGGVDLAPSAIEGPTLGDLAYLLYTSGSTGRPKGVLVEHGGLADYLDWAERQYVREAKYSFAFVTSLSFDLTVTSFYLPLTTGGTLEIYPRSPGAADEGVLAAARRNRVDFLKLTPSHLSLLRYRGLEGSKLRRLIVGGEPLATDLAATVASRLRAGAEIYNEYGPTEAIVGCVAHRFDLAVDRDGSVPIGAPADHVSVEILNAQGVPVPEGVPGELWISRYGLARGYHNLSELTADRFQVHPDDPDRRRYRTGDLVRQSDTTSLEFLGRIDRQLKIAGSRIEPAEIESALRATPGVAEAAVVASSPARTATGMSGKLAGPGVPDRPSVHCARCGLPSNYPGATFDAEEICSICRSYESIREHAAAYFRTVEDLRAIFEASRGKHRGRYDCMVLYSGGKDSTYALCQLVEMGYSVFAFTLDNGYISEGAKTNIRRVTGQLKVDLELATTPAMKAIFKDSLARFSNVCNGCFKTVYTLAMQRARELEIPIIVTGLSRGQMFETRLTEEMFRDGRVTPEEVDTAVLASRKAYHRTPDEVSRSLDVSIFQGDQIFEELQFVDFYRYVDVGMDELYGYLKRKVPWVRPEDTGRSTNCLINDAGIYVHQRERGFHNYALPYSWDVRLGHKRREEALAELDDAIDESRVREILAEVGHTGPAKRTGTALHAFLVPAEGGSLDETAVLSALRAQLPTAWIPSRLHTIESLPLTENGKLDQGALATLVDAQAEATGSKAEYLPPSGPVEEFLSELWKEELAWDRVGRDDSFFELGGTSLTAMRVMLRLCEEFDIDVPLETVFMQPTLRGLARVAEDRILADVGLEG